ncbi:MAG TPA: T9SS type A sorting domain-containing protein [Bacteroidia bacterium]|nr:T9SS type A sorting domain-containing protein [Bacteroidia bacterium]HNS11889.1 T9SS type A sorting domain-containing protein [Bacteroidia bacterium]
MKKLLAFVSVSVFINTILYGQDIRGTEMKYYISGFNTYTFELYLYTQTSFGVNRDTLISSQGDTLMGVSSRLTYDVTEYKYVFQHTYNGNGYFSINFLNAFRIYNIQNIANSSTQSILSNLSFKISPFIGENSGPMFSYKQTSVSRVGNSLVHLAQAIDPDGDSLTYKLVPTSSATYSTPPGATIDLYTGRFEMPSTTNVYAINILVEEWRQGILLSSTYREMLIDPSMLTIVDEDKISTVKVFPNPVHNHLNVEIIDPIGVGDIIIYNYLGEVKINESFDEPNFQVDLSLLSNGFYIVEFKSSRSSIRRAIVKE